MYKMFHLHSIFLMLSLAFTGVINCVPLRFRLFFFFHCLFSYYLNIFICFYQYIKNALKYTIAVKIFFCKYIYERKIIHFKWTKNWELLCQTKEGLDVL